MGAVVSVIVAQILWRRAVAPAQAINILHVQKCQWFWREEAAPAEPESCKAMTCQASTRSNLLTKSRITTTSSKVLSVAIIYKQASKKKFPPNVVTGI